MISVSLNVNSSQITAEWHAAPEQEMLDLHIEVYVRQFLGLRRHAATKEVVIISRFDDDWSIEPIAQTQRADT